MNVAVNRHDWHDWSIRAAVSLWFFTLAVSYVRDIASRLGQTMDGVAAARMLSQTCLFLFFMTVVWVTLMRDRPLAKAVGLRPRVVAFLGGFLVYAIPFLPRADLGIAMHLVSAALVLAGNILALVVLLNLGRSFSIMSEARALVTSGPYAVIRHPLYLAEEIAILGAFLQFASWPAFLVLIVHFGFQVVRMGNEELILRRTFSEYAEYMTKTARLIPGFW